MSTGVWLTDDQVAALKAQNAELLAALESIVEGELIITRDDDMAELVQLIAKAREQG